VNVTNDGWFQESEGSVQHFRNALFRSIELRRPTVRCANRGVTGVVTVAGSLVDPYTKEMRHLVDENGSYFHRGYLLASVYVPSEGGFTLYARFGDWFAVTGLVAGFLWMMMRLALGILDKERRSPELRG
jgi:apolipoprotein N-acyltransferase